MKRFRYIKILIIVLALVTGIFFMTGARAQTQYLPVTYYYTNPLYYSNYGYFNSINGYLLGYMGFSPFLNPAVSSLYSLAGKTTYPYFGSPYQSTFPYTTLSGTPVPYSRFSYPSYVYGDPSFYLNWTLFQ